jgi:hypothetical protein
VLRERFNSAVKMAAVYRPPKRREIVDWVFMWQALCILISVIEGSCGAAAHVSAGRIASQRRPDTVTRLIRARGLRDFTAAAKKRSQPTNSEKIVSRINPVTRENGYPRKVR